jgi:AraC-like DNA-binding protein
MRLVEGREGQGLSSIALIRASGLAPLEHWLKANGRPSETLFMEAGLPATPSAAPSRLVSLHAYMRLIGRLSESEGPDFGVRLVTPEAFLKLGVPARAVLGSRTIREALLRNASTLHQHNSHAFMLVKPAAGGVEVLESLPVVETALIHHQALQYVAGLVSTLGWFALGRPLPMRLQIFPHPVAGVDHLKPYLGEDIEPLAQRSFRMWISDDVLDTAFPWEPADELPCGIGVGPAAHAGLAESARTLIAGMLEDGTASIDRLALCAAMSRRTLQRQLAAEGTSYVQLLDEVRAELALASLHRGKDRICAISQTLGYRTPSSLTRAVRRWAEAAPRDIRRRHKTA